MRNRWKTVRWTMVAVAGLVSAPARAGPITALTLPHLGPRVEAANLALYERDVQLHDSAPDRFDHRHPQIGRLLGDPVYDREMLTRWDDHPSAFEHRHPILWRVVDGEMLWHQQHDGLVMPLTGGPPQRPDALLNVPTTPTGGSNGGGYGSQAVPEPSTGILMMIAAVAVAGASTATRAIRKRRQNHLG